MCRICLDWCTFSADIKEEAIDSRVEVKTFDQSKLKHTKTEEKNTLPTAQSKFHT